MAGGNLFRNMMEELLELPKIVRNEYLAEKILIVNGQPGCGKTMFSPIAAAMDRVELLAYAEELEYICSLYHFHKITTDAVIAMVRILTDLRLYDTMHARVNFRPGDLSSVFRDSHTMKYIKRLFQKGDELVPARIRKEKPILHLTTHNLLPYSEPLFAALADRLVFIEVIRHPLYMIKQQELNMKRSFTGNVRDFTIYFEHKGKQVPYFVSGWEDLFIDSNLIDKAIYSIEKHIRLSQDKIVYLEKLYNANFIIIPFEKFVVNPWTCMEKIVQRLENKITRKTRRAMKKQNVPRKMYAEGIGLKIYKRCGWEPPGKELNEQKELDTRRQFAIEQGASKEAMAALDRICQEYEERYLSSVYGLKRSTM
jgi:hypothetical protein